MLKELPAKGQGDYDCLVPLSGGKDSSYALHYVVRELGLKPLAASFDHGFVADMLFTLLVPASSISLP